MISQQEQPKQEFSRRCFGGYFAKYDVITELAGTSSSLTFERRFGGDGDNTKADTGYLLFRGARVRRSLIATAAAPKTRSRRLKFVQIKTYDYETKSFLDSGAFPNLILEMLCKN